MADKRLTINNSFLVKTGLFLSFLFSYNYTIRSIFYKSSIIDILICLFSIVLLFVSTTNKKVYKKQYVRILGICIFFLLLIIFRNGDIKEGNYGMPTIACWSVILILILNSSSNWISSLKKIIIFFTVEHTFFTWFFYIFRNLYLTSFVTKFDTATMWLLIYQTNNGYMAGLTAHYSTNAIYLSIGLIFLFSLILNPKELLKHKRIIIMLFILTFGALLITGKRAQLLFSLFAIMIIYVLNNKKKMGINSFKILSYFIMGLIIIVLLSNFIPELLNVYTRIVALGNSNDITNGRKVMYELANKEWEKHPFIGSGWGSYKYAYRDNIFATDGYTLKDAHNVYLQLLAETGIIGFSFTVLVLIATLISTYNLILLLQNNMKKYEKWKSYLLFSIGIQIFFILYCMTGNALYDCQILFPYTIGVSLMLAIKNECKLEEYEDEKKDWNINLSENS